MRNVGAPLFLRLGDRGRPPSPGIARQAAGKLRNVSISGVRARGCGPVGCAVAGLPGHPIENVSLTDLRLEFVGGGTAEQSRHVPEELPEAYPEFKMFGPLPAYGFYCRHVRNLRLRDVEVLCAQPDARPPMVYSNVEGLQVENGPAAGSAG